jgi:hypothetical protein
MFRSLIAVMFLLSTEAEDRQAVEPFRSRFN